MTADRERARAELAAARIRAVAAPVRAPHSLRAVVAERTLAAAPRGRDRGRRRPLTAVTGAVVLAALVLAFVLLTPTESPGGGSVADAAALALRAPTDPAPAAREASVGGMRFPAAASGGRWRRVGTRSDRIAGRRAVTVLYASGARRIGYTIVDGRPLDVPSGGRRLSYDGVGVTLLRRGDVRYVTWTRGGRTCVLATRGAETGDLLELAAAR